MRPALILCLGLLAGFAVPWVHAEDPAGTGAPAAGGPPVVASSPPPATVADMGGAPYVLRRLQKLPLAVGQELGAQDYIICGDDAFVQVRMGKGNNVRVAANSRLKLGELMQGANKSAGKIELLRGEVRCKLDNLEGKNFEVRTPVAVAGVRGTDFVVGYKAQEGVPAQFSLTVLKGSVSVAPPAENQARAAAPPIMVGTQQRVVMDAGGEAKMEKVSQAEVRSIQQASGIKEESSEKEGGEQKKDPGAGAPPSGAGQPGTKPAAGGKDAPAEGGEPAAEPGKAPESEGALFEMPAAQEMLQQATQDKLRETQQTLQERSLETIQETLRTEVRARRIELLPVPLPVNKE